LCILICYISIAVLFPIVLFFAFNIAVFTVFTLHVIVQFGVPETTSLFYHCLFRSPLLWIYWSCDPIGPLCCGGCGYCHSSGLWHQIHN